jgi:hypothetical protein
MGRPVEGSRPPVIMDIINKMDGIKIIRMQSDVYNEEAERKVPFNYGKCQNVIL